MMVHELMRPPDSETAEQAVEILRGWIIDGQPQYVIFPTIWKDDLPSWGRLLADTARHIANAITEVSGRDSEETLRCITAAFADEIGDPINEHEGEFHEPSL
jgi:hypothetical protein